MIKNKPSQDELQKLFESMESLPSDYYKICHDGSDVMKMEYNDEYLGSKLWRRIKRRILKRDCNKCLLCDGHGSVVHHRSYERDVLEGNADNMLITVCEGCHNIIHYDDYGKRRAQKEQEQLLSQKQLQTDVPEPKIDLRLRSQKSHPGGIA